MSKEVGIYTETMAKVYASQGHWAKAAEIYRHLLTGGASEVIGRRIRGFLAEHAARCAA